MIVLAREVQTPIMEEASPNLIERANPNRRERDTWKDKESDLQMIFYVLSSIARTNHTFQYRLK